MHYSDMDFVYNVSGVFVNLFLWGAEMQPGYLTKVDSFSFCMHYNSLSLKTLTNHVSTRFIR